VAASKKVLIIGMDGFTWDIGKNLMAKGVMPNLARLVEQGCHGILRSVIPSETAPAWSSFQTGCRPGKTGIFTFHRYDPAQKRLRFNNYTDIAVPTLWELASRAGKKVVAVNFPLTSPPPEIHGVMIPGLLCPGLSAQTVRPSGIYEKYIACERDYKIVDTAPYHSVPTFVDHQILTERTRLKVGLNLMKDFDWDIFGFEIQSSDRIQHYLWSALDSDMPGYNQEDQKEVFRFYRSCDEIMGELIKAAGSGVLTMLVSDHGFTSLKGVFNSNVWLKQNGYLNLLKKRQWIETKNRLKQRIPLLRLLARWYGSIKQLGKARVEPEQETLTHLSNMIDVEKSSAFSIGVIAGMLYLNVPGDQRSQLAQEITRALLDEYGPGSSCPVIAGISKVNEAFSGMNAVGCFPDLVLEFYEGFFAYVLPIGSAIVTKPDTSKSGINFLGTHSQRGVFLAHGMAVKPGIRWDGEIVDIAPTVLGYLGIQIPRHMDGKVLEAVFRQPLGLSYSDIAAVRTKESNYSAEEESEIQKRLSDLGYL